MDELDEFSDMLSEDRPLVDVNKITGPLTSTGDGEPPDHVSSISQRFRAPPLLLLGATAAFCAFVGSFGCVLMKYYKPKYRISQITNIPYESGMGYWPETVSESVSDPNSAAGKIFFAFCLIAALFLILSRYPFCLRNVYTGPAALLGGFMYWTTFREYVPTAGLLMLMGVSVYPSAVAVQTNGGLVCLAIHLTGAAMMFVGYMAVEFKTMEMFGMKLPIKISKGYLSIEGPERTLRQICAFGMAFFYLLFCVFEVLMVVQNPCCADDWVPGGTWFQRETPYNTTEWFILPKATVNNTASGVFHYYKVGAYMGECVAGIFLILSHYVIWYYCEERHVNYGNSVLEMVFDEHSQQDVYFGDDGEE
jgi:hypothetical protein